ncbi:acetyl-CoA synthetase-like protein [Neolentinus lepideus HHB14362 ss-1]|uniref:Acetyl-CoA synthetase-like protein n=1 Tax=Neolentinus lepideus HHB14362 ss-1 TaxID=1314782 RepID=A0A165Q4Q4_9AGAM|nr:acetyl-CoA synthetase-like protein [Neolentinus lepideus HHB14362 ss-1]
MSPRPTPQGVNSSTFKPAPFDHRLSVPGLYEYHAKNSPNHVVFTYSDLETSTGYDIDYRHAWESISTIASIVSGYYDARQDKRNDSKRPVIGILAISDTLTYIYLLVGIMSLGYTAFPLSPRNSPTVTAHLLEVTGVSQVYVSEDPAMQAIMRGAFDILHDKGLIVEPLPMIKPTDYAKSSGPGKVVDIGDNDVTVILHSSGTTALPKPIPITRRGLVNLSNIPCYGDVDLAGKRIAAHTNPMFHAMGLASLMVSLSSGAIFAVYKPSLSPTVPTPANFLSSWVSDKCNIVFCVPVFVEAWSRDSANVQTLRKLDCIVYSGAPVNKAIGDMLVNAGVTMHPFWGNTEIGPATMFIPKDTPGTDEWEYFKFSHHIEFVMQPEDKLDGIFEPIMIPTEICFPHVTNSELDGKRVFAVGDLLERHPTDTTRWRVFGRKDDQIVLSTGENVNPVPIETSIAQDEHIMSTIMFGTSHIEPGLLVEPAAGFEVPVGDKKKLLDFIDLIWPTIEKTNVRSPEYCQIKRNMVVVTISAKPLEHTAKGTPRRGVCLKLYADEVNALYAEVEKGMDAANRQFHDRV